MDNPKIISLKVGDNHNLMLSSEGELFANGDNSFGQLNGNLDDFIYYHCSPIKVNLNTDKEIIKIFAQNNRSAALLSNGEIHYWGGFSYHPSFSIRNLPKYDGFNIFNTEPGIPQNSNILDIGLGYFHDLVLVEENCNKKILI